MINLLSALMLLIPSLALANGALGELQLTAEHSALAAQRGPSAGKVYSAAAFGDTIRESDVPVAGDTAQRRLALAENEPPARRFNAAVDRSAPAGTSKGILDSIDPTYLMMGGVGLIGGLAGYVAHAWKGAFAGAALGVGAAWLLSKGEFGAAGGLAVGGILGSAYGVKLGSLIGIAAGPLGMLVGAAIGGVIGWGAQKVVSGGFGGLFGK